MSFIIRNGMIVLPDQTIKADIKIKNETIIAIGEIAKESDDEIIDASNCFVMPGGIDVHTHFDMDLGNMKTADDFISGSKAAMVGGTTTVLDFATQDKGESLSKGLDKWHLKAKNKSFVDYGFHMAITDWSLSICNEMEQMKDLGVTSFKMYMAYPDIMLPDDALYEALKKSKEINALIGFHCENGTIIEARIRENEKLGNKTPYYHMQTRPSAVENEAVYRILSIGKLANAPVWIVHMSTKEALEMVINARAKGQKVVCETCPQYVLLDQSLYLSPDSDDFSAAKYVLSPALRSKTDQDSLLDGLCSGSIDMITTDHCSFTMQQKEFGLDNYAKIPNGMPGVEHRVLLMYEKLVHCNHLPPHQFSKLIATNPAALFGLKNKGSLLVGKDADIVILNPNKPHSIHQKNSLQRSDYTPYENMEVHATIQHVFLRGKKCVEDGKLLTQTPGGKYIFRETSSIYNPCSETQDFILV